MVFLFDISDTLRKESMRGVCVGLGHLEGFILRWISLGVPPGGRGSLFLTCFKQGLSWVGIKGGWGMVELMSWVDLMVGLGYLAGF